MKNTTDSVTYALGRLAAAEAFAGFMRGGPSRTARKAVDAALGALIDTPARTPAELIGKLDRAWRFFVDDDESGVIASGLADVMRSLAEGQPAAEALGCWAEIVPPGGYGCLVRSAAADAAALDRRNTIAAA